ncbi:MAG: hypothetical protein O3A14_20325 [Cyanobacteria bacterium]|nr:hypothetical protein [Cyanobacteriota bacterium]
MPFIDPDAPERGAFLAIQPGIAETFVTDGQWAAIRPSVLPPDLQAFRAEFSTPGANSLYGSVLGKVAAAGFAAQDHWQNFKAVVSEGRVLEIPGAIAYLDQLLVAAGQPLSETEINGDTEQGDPYNGWNTLCDKYHFPEGCKF